MSDAPPTPPTGPGPGPGPTPDSDSDAWATACREDLDAERVRREERYGAAPPDPAAELRRLAEALSERLSRAGAGLGLDPGLLAGQARAVLEPVLERNAEVLRHLAGAGQELAAAYRAALLAREERWTRADAREPAQDARDARDAGETGDGDADGAGGSQRIDLD